MRYPNPAHLMNNLAHGMRTKYPAALLFVPLILVGCGDAFGPSTVAGVYTLISVDGNTVPATFPSDFAPGQTVTVESAVLTIGLDATFAMTLTATFFDGTRSVTLTDTESGTFDLVEPNTIRLTVPGDASVTTGTVNGDRITLIEDDSSFVYQRATVT